MGEIKTVEEKKAVQAQDFDLDPEIVKKYIAKGATDEELFMFLGICKAYGLNPFKREIHFVKYDQNSPASIIVGYETYLKRAVATGKLDGWRCWIEGKGADERAVIEIKRKDWSQPFRWEVYRREFDTGRSAWKRMPHFMLRKVAIAQGFRLAFPEDLGGMPYIPEEIEGAVLETEIIEEKKPVSENSRRAELVREFREVFEALGWTPERGKAFLKEHFGKESARELSDMELARAIGLMRRELSRRAREQRSRGAAEQGSKGAREQGSKGAVGQRSRGDGVSEVERNWRVVEEAAASVKKRAQVEQRSGGAVEQGSRGAVEQGSKGAVEQGSGGGGVSKGREEDDDELSDELIRVWEEIADVIKQSQFDWQGIKEEIKTRFNKDDINNLSLSEAKALLVLLKEQASLLPAEK